MYTSDKRILRLIDYLKFVNKISSTSDFCVKIDMKKQNITKIKKGTLHFTVQNIESTCKEFNINANWIFGINNTIFNSADSPTLDVI